MEFVSAVHRDLKELRVVLSSEHFVDHAGDSKRTHIFIKVNSLLQDLDHICMILVDEFLVLLRAFGQRFEELSAFETEDFFYMETIV